jgi:hypothetical protein
VAKVFGGFAVIDDDDDELDKSTPNVRVHLPFGIYTLTNELHISSQSFLDSTGADNIPAKDGYEYLSNDVAPFYLGSRELVQESNRDHNST